MSRRSRARQVALQVLYQDDLNPSTVADDPYTFLKGRLTREDLVEFARSLVFGVRRHREEIDAVLDGYAENWTLGRMAATDRNTMRLGAYEILHTDTPGHVAIDEAVELAKRFGSARSGSFVNGMLDRVLAAQRETSTSEEIGTDDGTA